MGVLVLVCVFLLFARAESYVLLTANVDDLHAIANQLSRSPVVEHLKDIWNRASRAFNSQYTMYRAENSDEDQSGSEEKAGRDENLMKYQRRRAINNLVELGRNATIYLKEMFESL